MSNIPKELDSSGKHSLIDIKEREGHLPLIIKRYQISSEINPQLLLSKYLLHREQIHGLYRVPKLISAKIDNVEETQTFEIQEELIEGKYLPAILSNDSNEIQSTTILIFKPLLSKELHYLPAKRFPIQEKPIKFMYDFKPDNFIYKDEQIWAVDFFPPLTRGNDGLVELYHPILDSGPIEYITYLYGDLVPIITRFILEVGKVNFIGAQVVAKTIIKAILESENGGKELLEMLNENSKKERVIQTYSNIINGELLLSELSQ